MEAMQFDSENENNKWYDAIKLEMESMLEYKVFKKWDKAILDKHITEVCHFGHFWLFYGRSATSGSPMGWLKGAP